MIDSPMIPHHILVVDDEKLIRDLLQRFLEGRGYRVTQAANGLEAVDAVRQDRPSLVLLDIFMPVMDGIAALVALRHIDPSLPVMMISGVGDSNRAIQSMGLGASDYIAKPFNLNYLELTLMAKLTTLIPGKAQ